MQCPDGPTSPSQSNRPIGLRPVVLATCDLCVHLDLACAIPPADRLYRTYSSELQLFGQHDAWPRPGHECCELRSFFCLLCLALQSKRLDRLVPWSLKGLRVLGCGGLGKAMPRAVRLGVDHEAFRDADRIVNVHLSVFARHGPGIVRGCFTYVGNEYGHRDDAPCRAYCKGSLVLSCNGFVADKNGCRNTDSQAIVFRKQRSPPATSYKGQN